MIAYNSRPFESSELNTRKLNPEQISTIEKIVGFGALNNRSRIIVTEAIILLLQDAKPARKPMRLLDLGAGDCKVSETIKYLCPDIELIAMDCMDHRHGASNVELKLYDGTNIPFEDNYFDVCLLCNSLHHSDNPSATFNEALRITSGKLIVKDHTYASLWQKLNLWTLDLLGNLRFGIEVNANYLNMKKWDELFKHSKIQSVEAYTDMPLREGYFAKVFPNVIEILFSIAVFPAGK